MAGIGRECGIPSQTIGLSTALTLHTLCQIGHMDKPGSRFRRCHTSSILGSMIR
jgi:hypothetical protein